MNRIKLQLRMGDALVSAGATEEIVALMQSCFDAGIKPGRRGTGRGNGRNKAAEARASDAKTQEAQAAAIKAAREQLDSDAEITTR
jgi:hypothetical protein